MSRTWHHGLRARKRKFGKSFFTGGNPPHKPTPPKVRRTKHHWEWMSTPSWWVREFMTVQQRAQTRHLLHKVKYLYELEDAPAFPLPKKPHIYYW